MKKIAIIGLGYVGLPLATEFGKKHKVVGFDKNKNRIQELIDGIDSTLETTDQERKDAINEQAQTNELNAVVEVITLGIGYWNAISRFAISRRMMTGNIQTTIHKINRGQIPADFSCKALLELKKKCEDLEFEFNE